MQPMSAHRLSTTAMILLCSSIGTAQDSLRKAPMEIPNWPVASFWVSPQSTAIEKLKEVGVLDPMAVESVPTPPLPFVGVAPCRIVDTRGNGAPIQGGIYTNGESRNYALPGICGIPEQAH